MAAATNIVFTELIKINGRLREFNFRKRSDTLYDVDVADERGTRYFFQLIKGGEGWTIQGKEIPEWILRGEGDLVRIVGQG